jgi:hypothetical protein
MTSFPDWRLDEPSPVSIRAARQASGLPLAQAAYSCGLGAAPRWAEFEGGRRAIDPARWALFLLVTDQHPDLRLRAR